MRCFSFSQISHENTMSKLSAILLTIFFMFFVFVVPNFSACASNFVCSEPYLYFPEQHRLYSFRITAMIEIKLNKIPHQVSPPKKIRLYPFHNFTLKNLPAYQEEQSCTFHLRQQQSTLFSYWLQLYWTCYK